MSLDIFAVHHSRNSRYIKACLFRYILEHHWFKIGLITIYEILSLIIHYCLHCTRQCIVTLLDCLNEPFGRIQLLLHECGRFLLFPFGSIGSLHKNVSIFLVHLQLWNREARHRQMKFSILVFQDEIGNDLLSLISI